MIMVNYNRFIKVLIVEKCKIYFIILFIFLGGSRYIKGFVWRVVGRILLS